MRSNLTRLATTGLAGALLTTAAYPALAEEEPRWFEIELLIFERNLSSGASNEYWPLNVEQLPLEQLPDHMAELKLLRGEPMPLELPADAQPQALPPETQQQPDPSLMAPVVQDESLQADNDAVVTPGEQPLLPEPQAIEPVVNENLRLAENQLADIASRLTAHSGYSVLLHESWQQPVLEPAQARAVRVYGGEDLSQGYYPHGQPRMQADSLPLAIRELQQFDPLWTVDGQFKLWLDRYLYLDTELLLRRAETVSQKELDQLQQNTESENVADEQTSSLLDDATPQETEPQTSEFGTLLGSVDQPVPSSLQQQMWLAGYKLHQQRRIRSGEIHYLDHPMMGVILQIRRIEEKPETETETATETEQ